MRNTETVFKDFFPFYAKDYLTSGARSRLTVPGRGLYLELLFLAYVEGGLSPDVQELAQRLGVPGEYLADLESATKEFETGADGRLQHPRVLLEIQKLEAHRARSAKGGRARKLGAE